MTKRNKKTGEIQYNELFTADEDVVHSDEDEVHNSLNHRKNGGSNQNQDGVSDENQRRNDGGCNEDQRRNDESNSGSHGDNNVGHHVHLQRDENPGLTIINFQLTGDNYMSWRRAMIQALTVEDKIDFVMKEKETPEEGTIAYQKWLKMDCLVTSWIINSMGKDVAEGFQNVPSSRELWEELEHRFGASNGPMLYKIQREISLLTQGNLSILHYFNKLKTLWDELSFLAPFPSCHCGASRACDCNAFQRVADMVEETKLIQFLMGLNESYDHVKNQILLMDPLPNLNKAYSMLLKVEKQSEISVTSNTEMAGNTGGAGTGQDYPQPLMATNLEMEDKEPSTSNEVPLQDLDGDDIDYSGHFVTSEKFETDSEAIDWAKKVATKIGFKLVISSHRNNGKLLRCSRGERYRGALRNLEAAKRKNTKTKACSCKFQIRVQKLHPPSCWGIRAFTGIRGMHNHALTVYPEGYRQMCGLSPESKQIVREMTSAQAKPSAILAAILEKYPEDNPTKRHVYNYRDQLRREATTFGSAMTSN